MVFYYSEIDYDTKDMNLQCENNIFPSFDFGDSFVGTYISIGIGTQACIHTHTSEKWTSYFGKIILCKKE